MHCLRGVFDPLLPVFTGAGAPSFIVMICHRHHTVMFLCDLAHSTTDAAGAICAAYEHLLGTFQPVTFFQNVVKSASVPLKDFRARRIERVLTFLASVTTCTALGGVKVG